MLNPCSQCKSTDIGGSDPREAETNAVRYCFGCGFIVHGRDSEWNAANPLKLERAVQVPEALEREEVSELDQDLADAERELLQHQAAKETAETNIRETKRWIREIKKQMKLEKNK